MQTSVVLHYMKTLWTWFFGPIWSLFLFYFIMNFRHFKHQMCTKCQSVGPGSGMHLPLPYSHRRGSGLGLLKPSWACINYIFTLPSVTRVKWRWDRDKGKKKSHHQCNWLVTTIWSGMLVNQEQRHIQNKYSKYENVHIRKI